MKRTFRGAVAALAFTALVAQPVTARAHELVLGQVLLPLYLVSVALCTGIKLSRQRQKVSQGQPVTEKDKALPICLIPGVNVVEPLANSN